MGAPVSSWAPPMDNLANLVWTTVYFCSINQTSFNWPPLACSLAFTLHLLEGPYCTIFSATMTMFWDPLAFGMRPWAKNMPILLLNIISWEPICLSFLDWQFNNNSKNFWNAMLAIFSRCHETSSKQTVFLALGYFSKKFDEFGLFRIFSCEQCQGRNLNEIVLRR